MSTALDSFAGVGWGIAARELGIEEEGIEIMPEAVATRDAIGLKTVHDDVWTYDYEKGSHEGKIDSPPCQTFSTAGKGAGRKALDEVLSLIRSGAWRNKEYLREAGKILGDDRSSLVLMPLHAAYAIRPRWLAWEQVPTVQPVWDACAEVLRGYGYSVWTGRLQAEQYGVPQTRRRSILIASLDHEVKAPVPTHSKYYSRSPKKLDEGVEKWMSMAEALGTSGDFFLRSNYGTGGDAANRGERHLSEPAPTVTSKVDRNKWILPEWAFNRPSTTIVGSFKPEIVAAPGYRTTVSRQNAEGSVRVEVHEAGLLQSFPADMPWQGSKTKRYLQVGNAVPPGLAIPVLGEAMGVPWEDVNAAYRAKVYGEIVAREGDIQIIGQARNSGPGAARRPRSLDEPSYTIRAQGSGSHPSGTEWVSSDGS